MWHINDHKTQGEWKIQLTIAINVLSSKDTGETRTMHYKVVITWSRLVGLKFCPALPGSGQCYKLFINHILRLHVKRFIPARRDSSFVQPGSRFVETKFSHVIASTRLGGIKKLIKKYPWKYISIAEGISIVFLRLIWCQSVRKKS